MADGGEAGGSGSGPVLASYFLPGCGALSALPAREQKKRMRQHLVGDALEAVAVCFNRAGDISPGRHCHSTLSLTVMPWGFTQ